MKEILRYIIIDDDPLFSLLTKILIESFLKGKDVQSFIAGEKGLSYIESNYSKEQCSSPTILFLDINMPTMSGWEFLERYDMFSENVKRQLQIYIVSSSIDSRDKERAK